MKARQPLMIFVHCCNPEPGYDHWIVLSGRGMFSWNGGAKKCTARFQAVHISSVLEMINLPRQRVLLLLQL